MIKKIANLLKSYFKFISKSAEAEYLAYLSVSKIFNRENKIGFFYKPVDQ